jgi:hypothetical protein
MMATTTGPTGEGGEVHGGGGEVHGGGVQRGPAGVQGPIGFELPEDYQRAVQTLAGSNRVKIDGRIEDGKLRIVTLTILPFGACNAAFDPVE